MVMENDIKILFYYKRMDEISSVPLSFQNDYHYKRKRKKKKLQYNNVTLHCFEIYLT